MTHLMTAKRFHFIAYGFLTKDHFSRWECRIWVQHVRMLPVEEDEKSLIHRAQLRRCSPVLLQEDEGAFYLLNVVFSFRTLASG
jgi:hypothetical protein